MSPHFLWLMRSFLLVGIAFLAFGSGRAQAQSAGYVGNPAILNTFVTSGGMRLYTGPGINPMTGRTFVNAATGGGVLVTEAAAGVGSGMAGGSLALSVQRAITAQNLLRAAVVYGTWDQAVGFGDVINGWLGQSRCVPLRFGETEQALCDPGAAPVATPAPGGAFCTYYVNGGDQKYDCSPSGARAAYLASGASERDLGAWAFANQNTTQYTAQAPRYCENCAHIPANQDGVTGRTLAKRSCAVGTAWNPSTGSCVASTTNSCPAITDPFYIGYNQAAGGVPGPDGKCRTGNYQPNPFADAATKITNNGGDPLKAKDVAKELVDNKGAKIDAAPGSLSGPATKTGNPVVTTKNNADGSKDTSTKTPTYNYTYGPTTVTVNNTYNTTNQHTNPDNTPGETTTETGTEDLETPEEAPVDTANPEQPTLYTVKFPNGIKGAWDAKMTEIKALPLFTVGAGLMPNFADGGSCPSWMIPLDFATWANFGTHDVAPPCWTWNFGAVVIVLTSLLLARRLIFGG